MAETVVFLNPKTCGIYKDGGARYKTDPLTGRRTEQLDNQLIEHVNEYLDGKKPTGLAKVPLSSVFQRQVLVPTYYDRRHEEGITSLLKQENLKPLSLGEMIDNGFIAIRGGHGSPPNDQRTGTIPYVKVSDIRGLRVNINPTNLVSETIARRFWRSTHSGLKAWDLVTPNRASNNIGEFAILLPGEERILLTKEVFVLRVLNTKLFDHFYLLWALSLKAVRDQWRRIVLMQTNREDCGLRYREIVIPRPKSREWAIKTSREFKIYFSTIATAKTNFIKKVQADRFEHVANIAAVLPTEEQVEGEEISDE